MKPKLTLLSVFFFVSGVCSAADYYWVGGSGNWSEHTTHWATSSGGSTFHTQIPTPFDDVYFDVNSFSGPDQTVTLNQTIIQCNNMSWSGVTDNPTLTGSNSVRLRIFGSLILSSAMTYNFSGNVFFESTTPGKTITLAGQTIGQVSFDGIGGGWSFLDAFSSSNISLDNGSLDFNSQPVTTGSFGSSAYTNRSLTMGSSVFTGGWSLQPENFTLDAGTSTIIVPNANASVQLGNGFAYYDIMFTATTGSAQLQSYQSIGGNTYHDVVFSAGGNISENDYYNSLVFHGPGNTGANNTFNTLTFSPGYTYTIGPMVINTLNATGTCSNYITMKSAGDPANVQKTSGTLTIDYVYLQNITGTGGATFIANNTISLGTNAGWTINSPAPQNLYWVGGSGNWNDGNHWSLSSGGSSIGCSPTSIDNVYFDVNSFSGPDQTVTLNQTIIQCNNMSWSGVTDNPTLAGSNSVRLRIFGSLILSSAMTYNFSGNVFFESTTPGKTITLAGQTIGQVSFDGIGGGWSFLDAFSSSNISLDNGSLDFNSQPVTTGSFGSSAYTNRSLTMGSSVFTGGWSLQPENFTLDAGTSTIIVPGPNASVQLGNGFAYYDILFTATTGTAQLQSYQSLGGNTYHDVVFSAGGNISENDYYNSLVFLGPGNTGANNTFNTLTFSPGYTYIFGPSQTINNFNATGTGGFPIQITSVAIGSFATLTKISGGVCVDFVRLRDIHAVGGAVFNAGLNSVDLGGNAGWNFNVSTVEYFADEDQDGYGNASNSQFSCAPMGIYTALNSDDCNDLNAGIHPGASENCNGIDDDCDGFIDEGLQTIFYKDADGDGFGNPAVSTLACTAPANYVIDNTDCNDANNNIHPGATETCNGLDDDCDGSIDEGVQTIFYQDSDNDGFGNPGVSILACTAPPGYVNNNTDCNDTNNNIHPGAVEFCNGMDENCDGSVDEGVQTIFYQDSDNDGFGNPGVSILACTAPSGYVNNNNDCNDTNSNIHPGAVELCNGMDDDCDGFIDEGVQTIFYQDADIDGFGNSSISILACSAPSGYINNNTDCNDANSAVYPGAPEICDDIDNNCNGKIDEPPFVLDCSGPVVVVNQSVTVNFNTTIPTYSGDPDLQPYFSYDKSGPTPDTWKAIFNLGSRKLLITNGATLTLSTVPLNTNNRHSPGIVILSKCDVEIQNGGHLFVNSRNRNAGQILIRVSGNIIIDGEIRNELTGTNNYPGEITIESLAGTISVSQTGLIQVLGTSDGGKTASLFTYGAGSNPGNITINGLVKSFADNNAGDEVNRPNIKVASFNGAVTINANTTEPLYDEFQENGSRFDIYGGLLSWTRTNNRPGAIEVQARQDIIVNGHGTDPTGSVRESFGAIAAIATGSQSPGGVVDVRSLEGNIIANNRSFDVSGKNRLPVNYANIKLSAKLNIFLNRPGANNNFNPMVDASSPNSGDKGGKNELRSYSGSIIIGSNAQVSASVPAGGNSVQGINQLTTCTGVINNGTVTPTPVVITNCSPVAPQELIPHCTLSNIIRSSLLTKEDPLKVKEENGHKLHVYPNPSEGKFILKINSAVTGQYLIRVMDITGRIIYNVNVNSRQGENIYSLDLSNKAKGVYMVIFENNNWKAEKKVVVQ